MIQLYRCIRRQHQFDLYVLLSLNQPPRPKPVQFMNILTPLSLESIFTSCSPDSEFDFGDTKSPQVWGKPVIQDSNVVKGVFPIAQVESGGVKRKEKVPRKVIKTIVRDINFDFIKPRRSGVILYNTDTEGILRFALGVDTASGDITDFGGRCELSDTNCVHTALRELSEETLNLFENIDASLLNDQLAIYDNNDMLIFVNIDDDINKIVDEFAELHKAHTSKGLKSEVSAIKLFTRDEFKKLVFRKSESTNQLYYKVRTLLYNSSDFLSLL